MKKPLNFPAKYSLLTDHERIRVNGGTAIGDAWDVVIGTITGLASAAADVAESVIRGEQSPQKALCSSFVYLVGNVAASIIWRLL